MARPNEWVKVVRAGRDSSEITNTRLIQLNIWTRFKEFCQINYPKIKLQKPLPQPWTNISIGTSICHIGLTLNTKESIAGCELYIPNNKAFYEYLKQFEGEISLTLGEGIEWKEMNKACRIRLRLHVENLMNESSENNYFKWWVGRIESFRKVFISHIKNFSEGEGISGEGHKGIRK